MRNLLQLNYRIMSKSSFNVLSTNAVDLKQQLENGQITSVQIVKEYFAQIDRHEATLNAFISPAPRNKVLKAAAALDEERKQGRVRSTLHGIPIVVKDCFVTASNLGMSTTCGAIALVGSRAAKNSAIAQRLIDAGLIIMGKTNMTEWCGMKMMTMAGFSAHGGQTLSPYVGQIEEGEKILGHSSPGGSSTGSAVAIAAGFSPFGLGTETIGSIITPANRHALYALKPTVGTQDCTGLYTMTEFYDSPGPMAKSAEDLRLLAELLLDKEYIFDNKSSFDGLSVGFVDPKLWTMSEELCTVRGDSADQMAEDFAAMAMSLKERGLSVKYPVLVPDLSTLPDTISVAHWEFKHVTLPKFLRLFEGCPISGIEDLVKFNEENKDTAMPAPFTEQTDLVKSMEMTESPEAIEQIEKTLREKGRELLDKVFDDYEVDVLVGPVDSAFCVHACAAGYPTATIPVGQLRYNGRPFGACLVARANEEEKLLRFQAACELASKPRPVPQL